MTILTVNGTKHSVAVPDEVPLLWVLREQLGMTGTKFGCGAGLCGACTVQVNGEPVRSCSIAVGTLDGATIRTVEGLSPDRSHPVQAAWIAEQVPQCGYCQSGMIMAAVSLLERKPKPTDADIDEAMTNICRCGTYQRVRAAIHRAAKA